MSSREITAACAICNHKPKGSDSGDCPCETKALRKAIEIAQRKWLESWMEQVNEWVTNAAVNCITTTFAALKERRVQSYTMYVNALPYYREYRHYQGRPPIHPSYIQHLVTQLRHADRELQKGVNEDWKTCILKYPEVLEYYYKQVTVEFPRGAVAGPIGMYGGHAGGPPTAFSGASQDRKHRRGGRSSAPPPLSGGPYAAPPDDGMSRRGSHRHGRRDSGSHVVSGPGRPAVPTPPMQYIPNYGGFP